MQITKHFASHEFARFPNKKKGFLDTVPYPKEWIESRLRPLCEALEVIRAELGGKPMTVGSGYRDPSYNKAIGGAKSSQHMAGRAADIVVKGVSPQKVHDTVLRLHREGRIKIGGLGEYPGFVHVDVRPLRPGQGLVRWTGGRKVN